MHELLMYPCMVYSRPAFAQKNDYTHLIIRAPLLSSSLFYSWGENAEACQKNLIDVQNNFERV